MILRRLAQSLKEQNWTAICVEFVLLVLGVFLGMQATNWNEARQERAQEAEYLARLNRDFTATHARLADNVAQWEKAAAAPVRLLVDLESFQRQGVWPRAKTDMLDDLGAAMSGRVPAPRAATYVELLSAGKLGLLRDTRLRDALLDFDTQTLATTTAFNGLAQRRDPHLATIVAHLQFDRHVATPDLAAERAARNTGAFWTDVDLAQLAADPGVKTALNTLASASRNQLFVAQMQQEKARAVLAILEPGHSPAKAKP